MNDESSNIKNVFGTQINNNTNNNGITEDVDTSKFIPIYGEMISDSLRINNNALINSLDEILLILNNYFMFINKVYKAYFY